MRALVTTSNEVGKLLSMAMPLFKAIQNWLVNPNISIAKGNDFPIVTSLSFDSLKARVFLVTNTWPMFLNVFGLRPFLFMLMQLSKCNVRLTLPASYSPEYFSMASLLSIVYWALPLSQ